MARKRDKLQEIHDFLATAPKEIIAEIKRAAIAAERRLESTLVTSAKLPAASKQVRIILTKPPQPSDATVAPERDPALLNIRN